MVYWFSCIAHILHLYMLILHTLHAMLIVIYFLILVRFRVPYSLNTVIPYRWFLNST